MSIKSLTNNAEYEHALKVIEELWNAEPGTPAGRQLDELIDLVEAYEAEHHTIGQPKATFRPSRQRLQEIAKSGADLLSDATDDDLGTFIE